MNQMISRSHVRHGSEIMSDVASFTNVRPTIQVSQVRS